MGAFNRLLLYKQINIPLSVEYIENNLSGEPGHGFTIVEVEDRQYKCLSNFSLGTGVTRGNTFNMDGIKIYMLFDQLASSLTTITFKTKLRPELIFAAAAMLLIIIVIISLPSSPDINRTYLFLQPLLPILLWFVYRIQENLLLKRIEKYLNELVNNKAS